MLFAALVLIIFASSVMYAIEGTPINATATNATSTSDEKGTDEVCTGQTHFSSIGTTMYWATMTVTTVGYGDMHPCTRAGQAVACVVALLGVVLFALPAGILTSGMMELVEETRHQERLEQMRQSVSFGGSRGKGGELLRGALAAAHGGGGEGYMDPSIAIHRGGGSMVGRAASSLDGDAKDDTGDAGTEGEWGEEMVSRGSLLKQRFSSAFNPFNEEHLRIAEAVINRDVREPPRDPNDAVRVRTEQDRSIRLLQEFEPEETSLLVAVITHKLAKAYLAEKLQ